MCPKSKAKLCLFETYDRHLAAVIHRSHALQLVDLKTTPYARWVFFDPSGQGEDLERCFDLYGADYEVMAEALDDLDWLSLHMRWDKYLNRSRFSVKAIAVALQKGGDYFEALGMRYDSPLASSVHPRGERHKDGSPLVSGGVQ